MNTALETSLKGLRILDASRVLAGPYCTQVLGDLGAEVIKIEEPGRGDETRAWGPPFMGDEKERLSAYFLSCNRNKKSVSLNLKSSEGREIFCRLAEQSDVVLENFRSDTAHALGLTAAALHKRNARLVVCSLSGFGRDGDEQAKPGYDFVVQAMSGMMAITGPCEGAPHKVGVAVADIVTGLYAGVAILAALHARRETGHGYAVELALMDCAVASMANVAQAYLTAGLEPPRQGNAHFQIVPYQLFRTGDSWLVLAVGNDDQWRKFTDVADCSQLAEDERFKTNAARVRHRAALIPLIEEILRGRSTSHWQLALDQVGVPNGPVWGFRELFSSNLASNRGFKMTVRRPDGTPVDLVRSPLVRQHGGATFPPRLGEHTNQVLSDVLGIHPDELARLKRDKVL